MPSAHTAFAVSIATVVGVKAGIASPVFVIAAAMVILILDDALRMRIFLSRHGLALSLLVKKLSPSQQAEFPYLETRLGHKVSEVIAGAALGFVASLLILFVVEGVA
jgi:acid phosphatase family membrane protein YuiD